MPVASLGAVGIIGEGQVRVLSVSEVHALSVTTLGLDADLLDLEAPEALAALVRRTASFAAPCAPRVLRGAVLQALSGLTASGECANEELRISVDVVIEALTSYGDLLELPVLDAEGGANGRTLYLAPPTYVRVDDVLFLLGGALDGADPVPSDLRALVECRSHTRRMHHPDVSDVASRLKAFGWVELRRDLWLPAPSRETPAGVVERAEAALQASPTTGEVPGLLVLDSEAPVMFYKARWSEPKRRTGRYLARREQRNGADLWSYVELRDGVVTHLVDLPLGRRGDLRPCDAAWHLQMAIDAVAGRPQRYRRRPSAPSGLVQIDFFSPVPLWARRRWDVLGEEIARSASLFAYSFPSEVFSDVELTLTFDLWLAETPSVKR